MTFDREPELSGSQKGRTMSLKGFRRASKITLCASLVLLTMGSTPLLAKYRSEGENPGVSERHRPLRHIKRVTLQSSYDRIFQKAECIADCGDGTGWECTGPSVSCEDGVGCSATDGTHTATGSCNAN